MPFRFPEGHSFYNFETEDRGRYAKKAWAPMVAT